MEEEAAANAKGTPRTHTLASRRTLTSKMNKARKKSCRPAAGSGHREKQGQKQKRKCQKTRSFVAFAFHGCTPQEVADLAAPPRHHTDKQTAAAAAARASLTARQKGGDENTYGSRARR